LTKCSVLYRLKGYAADRTVRNSGYCHAGQMADGNNVRPQNAKLRRLTISALLTDGLFIIL